MVPLQIHVDKIMILFLINRLNIWCKSLGNLRDRIWKQPSSSVGEIKSTLWKDRTSYQNVVVLLSQNHIKHDTLYSLEWSVFLIKGLFEPKYYNWIPLNVRAMPKTQKISERWSNRQIKIKEVKITFPTSSHHLM